MSKDAIIIIIIISIIIIIIIIIIFIIIISTTTAAAAAIELMFKRFKTCSSIKILSNVLFGHFQIQNAFDY